MITTNITLLNKFREGDHLVTTVKFEYIGDLNDEIVIDIYHFRPGTEEEVINGINNRAMSERDRLVSQKRIDEILPNIEI
jgi:hypothetical protein